MFKVSVKLNNIPQKLHAAADFGQFVMDEAVLKDSNYYIPMDTGALRDSSLMHSKVGQGEIGWKTNYARGLYYNPTRNFSKDRNANARGLWFEAAKAESRDSWLKQAEKAMKSKI